MADDKKKSMHEHDHDHKVAINVDGVKTPVLYSDIVYVSSSEFGVTLDFAQRVGPTNNQQQVVARVGMPFTHARKMIEVIQDHLESNER